MGRCAVWSVLCVRLCWGCGQRLVHLSSISAATHYTWMSSTVPPITTTCAAAMMKRRGGVLWLVHCNVCEWGAALLLIQ